MAKAKIGILGNVKGRNSYGTRTVKTRATNEVEHAEVRIDSRGYTRVAILDAFDGITVIEDRFFRSPAEAMEAFENTPCRDVVLAGIWAAEDEFPGLAA